MDTIGSRIKFVRKQKKLTQTDIQKLTGISSGNLSEIENNKSIPSAPALISLSKELCVSIDWLLTGEEYLSSQFVKKDCDSPEDIKFFRKFKKLTERDKGRLEERIEIMLNEQGESGDCKYSMDDDRATDE